MPYAVTNRAVPIGVTITDQPKSHIARRGIPAYIFRDAVSSNEPGEPYGITIIDQPKSRTARRGIPAYIFSGAEKPRIPMQVSRMFFARPMRAM